MKIVLFIFFLGVSSVEAQIRWDAFTPVAKDDSIRPALTDWLQKIDPSYSKGGVDAAPYSPWFELPFPSLKKLFPGFRFFTIAWFTQSSPGGKKPAFDFQASAFGSGIGCSVVCDPDGKLVTEFFHNGNYESFGKFLAARDVSIRSPEDARLVWAAFCDVHQHRWQDEPMIKVSDMNWHLGDSTIDDFHYYYEVLLDDKHVVKSATLHADRTRTP